MPQKTSTISRAASDHLRQQIGDGVDLAMVDRILILLRANYLDDVEHLIGFPISRIPPVTAPSVLSEDEYAPAAVAERSDWVQQWLTRHPADPSSDDRRVTAVAPNPRLPTTPAFQRYRLIKVGMTIGQLIRRGVTRKDILEAVRAGWVSLA